MQNSINLIFGSSWIKEAMIPDSLGSNWFSFANPNQNIYESFKFLEYYNNMVEIDTIIYSIQPFDFPDSYIKNRIDNTPYLNGNFYLFGSDSITSLNKTHYLRNLQALKEIHFPNINNLFRTIMGAKDIIDKQDVWTKQGYTGRINIKPINIDTLKRINTDRIVKYYSNVNKSPNLFYFNKFDSLTRSLDIKVIYLVTPKAKQYRIARKREKKDKIWEKILIKLENKDLELWNYESMRTDTFDVLFFRDAVHLSYDGAQLFSKMIRNKLK